MGVLALLGMLGVLAFLSNASLPGREIEGCLQGCAQGEASQAQSLRVLSLNMLHGHPDFESLHERRTMIAGEIERLGVDIALLQEVPWTRRLERGSAYLAGRSGMNSAYLRANGNRWLIGFEEGELVLSRFPLVFVERSVLQPAAGFFENRVVLHAIVQASSRSLDLYVTHLTNGAPQVNQAQAESLRAFVEASAQHTALVAGDFNALEDSPQIASLSQDWLDTFRTANPHLPGFTCCIDDLSAAQAELSRRIDYIFLVPAGEQVEIVEARVVFDQPQRVGEGWLWASDHAGVLLEINY
jgi:endonuclease/exonuclease/phosphatase family metal-dependent hydrolase